MKTFMLRVMKFLTLSVGVAMMGILMVPAGALVMLISTVWKTTDKVVAWLEEWQDFL